MDIRVATFTIKIEGSGKDLVKMLHDPTEIEYYLKTGILLQKIGMRLASSTASKGRNLSEAAKDEVCISKGQTVDVPFLVMSYDHPSANTALEVNIVSTLK